MSKETAKADEKQSKPWQFKKGFDERRWLKGRPKVPKDRQQLFDGLIWEILSEEVEHPITKEKVDRLRLMLRSMTTNKNQQDKLLDRVFGKVQERVDVTTNGKDITQIGLNTVDYRTDLAKTEE